MKNHKLSYLLLLLMACQFMACATAPNIGYTAEPSKEENKVGNKTLTFEILLIKPDRKPLGGYRVTASTAQGEGVDYTNNKGVARVTVVRKESEPILFTFKSGEYESAVNVRSLPTNFDSAGLVFESTGPGRVKLSHYAVEGLYR